MAITLANPHSILGVRFVNKLIRASKVKTRVRADPTFHDPFALALTRRGLVLID
jgi:hypothetical protein